MSSGSGGKPDGGTQPGRPAADTPQRLVVRSLDPESDSKILGAHDTAVANLNRVKPLAAQLPGTGGTPSDTARTPATSAGTAS